MTLNPNPDLDPKNQADPETETVSVNKAKNQVPENIYVETIKTLATAAILAFGIRTFVAEARYIPSESMLPTLEVNDRLIIEKVSYHFNKPKHGDVVVFEPPDILKPKFKDAFIKRIIGLPGDTVEVKFGKVYLNGKEIKENYIKSAPEYNFGPVTVPEDQYLVFGDNRNNSYDSHLWDQNNKESYVPRENLIGRAVVRFWPPDRIGSLQYSPEENSSQ